MQLAKLLNQPTDQPSDQNITVTNVTDDSRHAKAGDVCVLDHRNHPKTAEFATKAAAKGAIVVANIEGEGVIYHPQPGQVLARWAIQKFPQQPKHLAAVTGTNGKTSVAWFYQQLIANSASIGTLGVYRGSEKIAETGYTSPTPLKLHPLLQQLAEQGVEHCCLEASSHALDLERLYGVEFEAAALTHITQDHLDYHGTMEAYIASKMRLFSERLKRGGTAVINVQHPSTWPAMAIAQERGAKMLTVGSANAELVVQVQHASAQGLELAIKAADFRSNITVPLVGAFQAQNIAVALGLALGTGVKWPQLAENLSKISGVPGRMELFSAAGKPTVVVDYAHTADALARALASLKPLTQKAQSKLWVVFGAGGDRDASKRQPMGRAAAKYADQIIITDDNPRSEDPTPIRAQIKQGCPNAEEVADRHAAISKAIAQAQPQDVILLAGKGHETGQIIGKETMPFDDRQIVQEHLT